MKKGYLSCAIGARKEVSDEPDSTGFVFQGRKAQNLNRVLD